MTKQLAVDGISVEKKTSAVAETVDKRILQNTRQDQRERIKESKREEERDIDRQTEEKKG